MTEERLKEIKELIDDFKCYIEQKNNQDVNGEYEYPRELTQEEAILLIELYNEIVRLRKIIKEANDEIEYFELQAKHLDDSIYLDEKLINKLKKN